jgi:hypothetical protein
MAWRRSQVRGTRSRRFWRGNRSAPCRPPGPRGRQGKGAPSPSAPGAAPMPRDAVRAALLARYCWRPAGRSVNIAAGGGLGAGMTSSSLRARIEQIRSFHTRTNIIAGPPGSARKTPRCISAGTGARPGHSGARAPTSLTGTGHAPVSRFRSSPHSAARSHPNFRIERALASIETSVVLDLKSLPRGGRKNGRVKSTTLAGIPKIGTGYRVFGSDCGIDRGMLRRVAHRANFTAESDGRSGGNQR